MQQTDFKSSNFSEPLGVLPRSHRVHWTPSRKAQVVRAVQIGLLSFEDARKRYMLSRSEFQSWQRCLTEKGLEGLRIQ